MKTTIEISDALLRAARRLAAERDTTLRPIVEAALRRHLEAVEAEARARRACAGTAFAAAVCSRGSARATGRRSASGPMKAAAGDRDRHQHPGPCPSRELRLARCGRPVSCRRGRIRHAPGDPWPCVHEFLAIVTHPRIYDPPTPLDDALEQVDCWLEVPSLVLLAEAAGYGSVLRDVLAASRTSGPRVHDARIAALCRQHGVAELWTADRDFGRFSGLKFRNPLVAGGGSQAGA